ncbi:hypothetical protein EVAR_92325_1 [Eumeta japonica]|uniref:Single domain-containing protein n=1 Tax=Eumeta variegata TaxID=151549 RepID=A0A4C1TJQ6_EUMVA|nr:hypothetical protein EVAR_92325_1 [Eumeta japonica]
MVQLAVRYQTLTECRREATAFVVAFRLAVRVPGLHCSLYHLTPPSIVLLHPPSANSLSIRYPVPTQEFGDAADEPRVSRQLNAVSKSLELYHYDHAYDCFSVCGSRHLGGDVRWPLPEKPKEFEHKEGCYVREINDVVPFGKTVYPIGYCYEVRCSRSGMLYASCGVAHTSDPKCYVTETDVTKPYPHCCPDIKCNA